MACVVDASVAAKWILPSSGEGFLDEANHLLDRYIARKLHMMAPDLLGPELGNVLWKAVRRKRMSATKAEESLRLFTELSIPVVASADLMFQALEISVTCDRSFYDSLYVALAVITRAELITADERLVNAMGARYPVRWLGAL